MTLAVKKVGDEGGGKGRGLKMIFCVLALNLGGDAIIFFFS
jgi:hypothetical protein